MKLDYRAFIHDGFLMLYFLMMLIRDLYPESLEICVAFDLVPAATIFYYAYRIAGSVVLMIRDKRRQRVLYAKRKDPLRMPTGVYRDVIPFQVISKSQRANQKERNLHDDKPF